MKATKRILAIKIEQVADTDPDTSYLGTFDDTPKSEFAIPHRQFSHDEWFNPQTVEAFNADATWIPADVTDREAYWREAMRKNAAGDYERMVSYNRDLWSYIGIRASAEIVVGGISQTVHSGGLYGIESDSGADYFAEVSAEQLAELRGILGQLGFSKRAVATACKAIKNEVL